GSKRSSSAWRCSRSRLQPTTERPGRARRTMSAGEGTTPQHKARRGCSGGTGRCARDFPQRTSFEREPSMPVSETSIVERIARVLAGQRASANADGYPASAGDVVDDSWREHEDDARAVLRTLREPDPVMASAGDVETWRAMVEAALEVEG